jgi:hypothetical protein
LKLRVGYELQYEFLQPTPLVAMLNVHFSRVADLVPPDQIVIIPSVPTPKSRSAPSASGKRLPLPR